MLLDFEMLNKKYQLKINGILAIGAHYGEENSIYVKHTKNICYFEPLIHNFEVLVRNVGNTAVCINKALGDENKMVEMFVEYANSSQSSSILEPVLHLTQYPHIQFTHKVSNIPMQTLDSITEVNLKDYNFINIDTQGTELLVLMGAKETLNHIDYIMSEVNNAEVYKDCAKIWEIDAFLKPYGFKLVEEDWTGLTWGDAFWTK